MREERRFVDKVDTIVKFNNGELELDVPITLESDNVWLTMD